MTEVSDNGAADGMDEIVDAAVTAAKSELSDKVPGEAESRTEMPAAVSESLGAAAPVLNSERGLFANEAEAIDHAKTAVAAARQALESGDQDRIQAAKRVLASIDLMPEGVMHRRPRPPEYDALRVTVAQASDELAKAESQEDAAAAVVEDLGVLTRILNERDQARLFEDTRSVTQGLRALVRSLNSGGATPGQATLLLTDLDALGGRVAIRAKMLVRACQIAQTHTR
jgi:hypothetical protein